MGRSTKPSTIPFTGTLVYYGYDKALAAHTTAPTPLISPPKEFSKEEAAALTNTLGVGVEEDVKPGTPKFHDTPKSTNRVGDEGSNKVTDLILVVHGIGQGVRLGRVCFEGVN